MQVTGSVLSDSGEPLGGVAVSDGRSWVVTRRDGSFPWGRCPVARYPRRPARAGSKSITIVSSNGAAPAASGENPSTRCSGTTITTRSAVAATLSRG